MHDRHYCMCAALPMHTSFTELTMPSHKRLAVSKRNCCPFWNYEKTNSIIFVKSCKLFIARETLEKVGVWEGETYAPINNND